MPFELTGAKGRISLALSGRVGVQQARPLWDALEELGERQSVLLSAEHLDEIDTSIIQILCRLGPRLRIGDTSDALFAALKGRGLEDFFAAQGRLDPPGTMAA